MIEYINRYSDNDELDDMNRWARIAVVNDIQIGWISKHILNGCEKFSVSCNFPTVKYSDIGTEHKVCDSLDEAKDFISNRWNWFKENTK